MTGAPHSSPSAEPLELGGELWLRAGEQTLGGTTRIALLAAIGDTGSITRAAKAVFKVLERGINTSLIMSPGVPVNAARLRFFLTCEFTPDEITHALDFTKEVLTR